MSLLNLGLSSALAHDIGWTLVHFLWQGALLAALLEAVLPLCRGATARHNWAVTALAAMCAAPIVTFLMLHQSGTMPVTVAGALPAVSPPVAHAVSPATIAMPWTGWLVACWLAGILLLSLRAVGGLVLVRSLRRSGAPLSGDLLVRCQNLQRRLGLRLPVRFLQTSQDGMPMVVGWLRPIVLIPVAAIAGLPPQQLDALIMHELAHIRRLDAFINLFLMLVETLLFYHPAVWWAARRVRIEREHCCDDMAVTHVGDVTLYVEALTALQVKGALPALALAAQGGKLSQRVARLLEMGGGPRRAPLATAAGLVLAGAVLAAIVAPALAQPKQPPANSVKDAVLTWMPDKGEKVPPLMVDANKVVQDKDGKGASFTGNVVVKIGTMQIHANSAHSEQQGSKVAKVTLDGNVVLTGPQQQQQILGDFAQIEVLDQGLRIHLAAPIPPVPSIPPVPPQIEVLHRDLRIHLSPPIPPVPSAPLAPPVPGVQGGLDAAEMEKLRTGLQHYIDDLEAKVAAVESKRATETSEQVDRDLQNILNNNRQAQAQLAQTLGQERRSQLMSQLEALNKDLAGQHILLANEPLDAAKVQGIINARLAQAKAEIANQRAQLAQLALLQAGAEGRSEARIMGQAVSLTVQSDGAVLWNGNKVDDATLEADLKDAAAKQPQTMFMLKAEAKANPQRVQAVVDSAIRLGITRIMVERGPPV